MIDLDINYNNLNLYNNLTTSDNKLSSLILEEIKDLPALAEVENIKLLDSTIDVTNKFIKDKENFIVFGTGGSNLGGKALVNILQGNEKNNIIFYDNIDPIFFENSLKKFDLYKTGFIIISKSGSTPETLSQLGSLIELFDQQNSLDIFYNNILIITEDKETPLNKFAKDNKCTFLKHEEDVGGRYSVFTNVGIVPAIIAGLDVKKFCFGASTFKNNIVKYLNTNKDFNSNIIFKLPLFFKYFKSQNKITNSVIMTYSDALYNFGKWYLQLWAESIGKNSKGITAIHAMGTTDQHSQLQLYLDGPKDKFFTFITTDHSNKGLKLHSESMKKYKINYLVNKKMGDLMQAEQQATIDTFNKYNFLFREIRLPKIDEFYTGQLMALSIFETVATCRYFDVNPYDQPAVEQGKKLTKEYLY